MRFELKDISVHANTDTHQVNLYHWKYFYHLMFSS